MADDKKNDKALTPGAVKAQSIKDAATEASGTKAHAHITPVNPTEGSKVPRIEDEGEEIDISDVRGTAKADVKSGVRTQQLSARETEATEKEHFVTGFNFDMVQLTELYANMRDGNYWSAFKLVINILHPNVNASSRVRGPTRGPVATRPQVPVKLSEVDDITEKLESLCGNLETDQRTHTNLTGSKEAVRASREPKVEAVDPIAITYLIKMLVDIIKGWRGNRS